ncbi:PLC-like phosphodiesterase [Parathielavia appendiculata]|uniref:PLC-like phosphodiesterase n=1 Tax=Parathielavia appendiculata TaxID=2587402 RepID=A0AAN6Z834_9PEZI|nr:PLC-like phosphodiesterase [Parathielavia appendiculata]
MGFIFSQPVAAAALPMALPTLTIRNLTVTTLELKLVERLDSHTHPNSHKPEPLAKTKALAPGSRRFHDADAPPTLSSTQEHDYDRPSSARREVTGVTIQPFTECRTRVYAPNPNHRHEQLRLTFEDTGTGHLYSAEIPASSRRSIVLKPHPKDSEQETKEFTAIYLAQHAYLALFSSANLSTWMSTLDRSLPLSALSIPGTHNSPTCHVALPSVRCQAVSVQEQLNNGVRFLDVRVSCPVYKPNPPPSCSPPNNTPTPPLPPPPELSLVHSAFPISLTGRNHHLSDLLTTLYTFLSTYPSETILLSLKREGIGRGTDHHLSQILHMHYINGGGRHKSKWYTSPRIPTLAQARGRIVLVRRYHLHPSIPASQGGIDGSVWPDNVADGTCGSGTIRIQDYYGVGSGAEVQRKLRFAQEGLQRAAAQAQGLVGAASRMPGEEQLPDGGVPQMPPLFINFLSASNFFNANCWPDRIAVKMNPSMIEYLCMSHGAPGKGPGKLDIGDSPTGIVVTDWVGHQGDWDLVRCIVGWNARLQLRQ